MLNIAINQTRSSICSNTSTKVMIDQRSGCRRKTIQPIRINLLMRYNNTMTADMFHHVNLFGEFLNLIFIINGHQL